MASRKRRKFTPQLRLMRFAALMSGGKVHSGHGSHRAHLLERSAGPISAPN